LKACKNSSPNFGALHATVSAGKVASIPIQLIGRANILLPQFSGSFWNLGE